MDAIDGADARHWIATCARRSGVAPRRVAARGARRATGTIVMHDQQAERRRRVASLVRDLYDSRIGSADFFGAVDRIAPGGDPELAEILELLRQEQAGSWFFGVAAEDHRRRTERIRRFVEEYG
jgi:hypothetical protein